MEEDALRMTCLSIERKTLCRSRHTLWLLITLRKYGKEALGRLLDARIINSHLHSRIKKVLGVSGEIPDIGTRDVAHEFLIKMLFKFLFLLLSE